MTLSHPRQPCVCVKSVCPELACDHCTGSRGQRPFNGWRRLDTRCCNLLTFFEKYVLHVCNHAHVCVCVFLMVCVHGNARMC